MSQLQALLAACAVACAPAYAADVADVADVAAGKAKAEEVCADCHGDDGRGNDHVPDIVKLSLAEFNEEIEEFRSGDGSKESTMNRVARRLTPADIANLAAYYETLK